MGKGILILGIVVLSLGIVVASVLLVAPDAMFSPDFDSDGGEGDPTEPTSLSIQLTSPAEGVTLSYSPIQFRASVASG